MHCTMQLCQLASSLPAHVKSYPSSTMHRHPRIHNGATTQRLLPPLRALTPDLEPGVVAAYGTLGASAVGFVGTFAVAPRFREQFKEDLDWREIYAALVQQGGVRTVTAQDAYRQTSGGKAVLLDVRMARKYEQGHAVNAVNVPLYNPISKWDIPSIIRRAGFAFFGIYGTELNRDFAAQAELALAKSKDIYVLCEMGGSLENKPGVTTGFQSRSLKAIYRLQEAGYRRVYHVQGGMIDWNVADLPVE